MTDIRNFVQQVRSYVAYAPAADENLRRYDRVYIVVCRETDRIKIGYSSNPWMRAASLTTASPTHTDIAYVLDAGPRNSHGKWLERRLHQVFAERRYRGEWFEVTRLEVTRAACDLLDTVNVGVAA